MKVTSIEIKSDKNNNPMKVTTFDGGQKVFVNSKYDAVIYEAVVEGADFEIIQENGFNKIKYDKPANTRPTNTGGAVAAAKLTSESVTKAQLTKEEAIAMAGSASDATAMVTAMMGNPAFAIEMDNSLKAEWEKWRKYFYEQRTTPFV